MERNRIGGPCLPRWKGEHNVRARRLSRLAGSLLLVAILCGCSDGQSHAGSQTSVLPKEDMPPVILVPGADGSTLVTTDGRSMWEADLSGFFNANLFTRLALPLPSAATAAAKAKLVPHDLVRGLLWQDYYGGLIDTIERRVGVPCVLPGAIGANTRCVLFPWDWRGDMTAAAARLDALIDRLCRARREPGLRVDLVAHSSPTPLQAATAGRRWLPMSRSRSAATRACSSSRTTSGAPTPTSTMKPSCTSPAMAGSRGARSWARRPG